MLLLFTQKPLLQKDYLDQLPFRNYMIDVIDLLLRSSPSSYDIINLTVRPPSTEFSTFFLALMRSSHVKGASSDAYKKDKASN